MKLLTWKPEYSVGIDSVDAEHREMIELLNRVYLEMNEDRNADSVEQCLGDIHAAISSHFALEEQVMKRSGYGEYEAHKEDHERLLDHIRDLMDTYHLDAELGLNLLQEQLADWFEVHFSTFDARLHGNLDKLSG